MLAAGPVLLDLQLYGRLVTGQNTFSFSPTTFMYDLRQPAVDFQQTAVILVAIASSGLAISWQTNNGSWYLVKSGSPFVVPLSVSTNAITVRVSQDAAPYAFDFVF